MKNKYFIITVDTEGDNLWKYKEGESIGVKNAEFLPRFQTLCEEFGFKPVYLTNYEMACSDCFVRDAQKWLNQDNCEIGVHLHAWNNPPLYKLDGPYCGNPYLIEYSTQKMFEKFDVIYTAISNNFGIKPISHRAGRWAMDNRYFKILEEYGIKVDCSFTPGIDWSSHKGKTMGGSNYKKVEKSARMIGNVLEVPITIVSSHMPYGGSLKHKIKTFFAGESIWLRTASSDFNMMKCCIDSIEKTQISDYVEFMIHSSEVMPGGSPYFPDKDSVERHFETMRRLFTYASERGFSGCTLQEYYNIYQKRTKV